MYLPAHSDHFITKLLRSDFLALMVVTETILNSTDCRKPLSDSVDSGAAREKNSES
jgi:hypothetical protein